MEAKIAIIVSWIVGLRRIRIALHIPIAMTLNSATAKKFAILLGTVNLELLPVLQTKPVMRKMTVVTMLPRVQAMPNAVMAMLVQRISVKTGLVKLDR
jgi:hypothetical protein